MEFLSMGGYAFYVWASFGLTTVILASVVIWSAQQLKQSKTAAFRRALQHRKR
ncbi:MAG: heme exporter protein CcmD [Pseudomonadales bacterium]|jgi:heme exporter protein CcmD